MSLKILLNDCNQTLPKGTQVKLPKGLNLRGFKCGGCGAPFNVVTGKGTNFVACECKRMTRVEESKRRPYIRPRYGIPAGAIVERRKV